MDNKYKLLNTFLNNISETRPILKSANTQLINGVKMTIITDSYLMFCLKEDIAELPHKQQVADHPYPSIESIYNNNDGYKNANGKTTKIDISKLKMAIKEKHKIVEVNTFYFNSKKLQLMLKIMETDEVYLGNIMAIIENDLGKSILIEERFDPYLCNNIPSVMALDANGNKL